ncbi:MULTISPECIES: hypothetical protein [Vibrio]|uniref:hypothetical protein n=1 Tax=Vibrionaceae TaxID=641 RepID=UPI0019D43B5F|nr:MULTISPECIES: hypothetical protein [Vibrio]EHY9871049.1 hypothetical protein [Vibrio vulnificus]EIC2761689.1 hypothetical protein [Vibrio vulnificus]EKA6057125.1 hypothetical protein [Vibrio parahaemolyticus]ELA7328095.1 hypothetical protein [Vibrio alginolyticus]ELB1642125.1 hypothetical protein [Vibrio alginolyticus]
MSAMQWLTLGGLLAIFLFALYQMIKAAVDFRRDYPRYRGIYSQLESFEKHCFKSGLSLFFLIPIVKNSKYSQDYIFQVLSEIGTALAGGMFLIGVIAFIRELHNSRSNT